MIPWKYLNLLKNLVYQYKVLETIEDETKRWIFWCVIRYISWYFIRKYVGKGVVRGGGGVIWAGEGTNREGQDFFMSPRPLTNFETQKYNQNEPRFNGVYSKNNLPKIKDEAYVINLDG